jgi:hypothetical protein
VATFNSLLALRVFRQIGQRPVIGARERLVESPDEVFLAESSLLDAGQDDRTDQELRRVSALRARRDSSLRSACRGRTYTSLMRRVRELDLTRSSGSVG